MGCANAHYTLSTGAQKLFGWFGGDGFDATV